MTYKELKEAKEILGLGESGTLEDVKRKYRELVKNITLINALTKIKLNAQKCSKK